MSNAIGFGLFITLIVSLGIFLVAALLKLLFLSPRRAANESSLMPVAVDPQATIVDASRSWAQLPPTGREVFFPTTHANALYQLTVTGVLRRAEDGRPADGFFQADKYGNFVDSLYWVRVNNRRLHDLGFEILESDRCAHRYTVRFRSYDRLTLSLRPCSWEKWDGALFAEITALPEGSLTNYELMNREHAERAATEAADNANRAAAKERAADARHFAHIIQTLAIRAETNRNWRDPAYQQKFARVHCEQLIQNQKEIRQEAEQLLEQPKVVAYLQRHAPTVMPTLLGRLEALLIAENLALDNAIVALESSKPQPVKERPKRKLTAAQVQERIVRRQQIKLGDKLALAKNRVATIEDVKGYVRGQYAHLAEDEQQQIIQNILDQIEEAENRNGKTL